MSPKTVFAPGRAAMLLLSFALSGCASLSEQECLTADWYNIGYEDGLQGRPAQQIAEHRKACAEHGVSADLAEYNRGRQAGLEQYCEPRNGYRLGRAGTAYGGVCPAVDEDAFLAAYNRGYAIHDLQQRLQRVQRRVESERDALVKIDESIIAKEAELIHVGVTPQRRAALLQDLKTLQRRQVQVQETLHGLRGQERRLQNDLAHRLR